MGGREGEEVHLCALRDNVYISIRNKLGEGGGVDFQTDERTLPDHELMDSWRLHEGAEHGFVHPV